MLIFPSLKDWKKCSLHRRRNATDTTELTGICFAKHLFPFLSSLYFLFVPVYYHCSLFHLLSSSVFPYFSFLFLCISHFLFPSISFSRSLFLSLSFFVSLTPHFFRPFILSISLSFFLYYVSLSHSIFPILAIRHQRASWIAEWLTRSPSDSG